MKNKYFSKSIAAFILTAALLTGLCSCTNGNTGISGNTASTDTSGVTGVTSGASTSTVQTAAADSQAAASTAAPTSAPTIAQTDTPDISLWYYYNQLNSSQKSAYMELYNDLEAYINGTDTAPFSCTLQNYGTTVADGSSYVRDIMPDVGKDNPIISEYLNYTFFTCTAKNGCLVYQYNNPAGKIINGDPPVYGDITAVRRQIKEIGSAAATFLSGVPSSMSDIEKYHLIAQKLCDETQYDYDAYNIINVSGPDSPRTKQVWLALSLYGGLVNHLSVCQGFSIAYQYLCQREGLPCDVIIGQTPLGLHAWNVIKLDEDYYNVDVTWMQGTGTWLQPINDSRYFCLTDKQLAVDHTKMDPPACTATKYAYDGGKIPS